MPKLPKPTNQRTGHPARALAARPQHCPTSAGSSGPQHRLHHRAQVHADHDRKGPALAERCRAHARLRPAVPEETTQRQLVKELLDRAFGGSASKLVLQALSSRKASPAELIEIRRLLDRMEKGGK